MTGLISPAEAVGIRAALSVFFTPSCDGAPMGTHGSSLHRADAHSVLLRQIDQASTLRSRSPDVKHVTRCQLSVAVPLAMSSIATALRMAIRIVLSVCPQEQVGRVAAGRVIAVVENAKPIWNRPETQNPRGAVSELFIFPVELPVTVFGTSLLPRPAGINIPTQNLRPEPIFDGHGRLTKAYEGTRAAAILPTAVPDARRRDGEFLAARLARSLNVHSIIASHRDVSLTRNRGARPGPVDAGYGASSCLNFTTLTRREAA